MHVIIIKWLLIKPLKNHFFLCNIIRNQSMNAHCFTPVHFKISQSVRYTLHVVKYDHVLDISWKWIQWAHLLVMMTSSNGNIFRVTGPLCGEFTGSGKFPTQRPVTRSFDVFFDLRLNKRLSKQPWDWWFETPSWSLWRHCNVNSGGPRFIRRFSRHHEIWVT